MRPTFKDFIIKKEVIGEREIFGDQNSIRNPNR